MSKQLDLSKPLDQDTIDDLLQRYPVERVQYLIEQSNLGEFDGEEQEQAPSEEEVDSSEEQDDPDGPAPKRGKSTK